MSSVMPKAIEADWPLIQTLYAQGVSPKNIAQKTGVRSGAISQRANRKGWRKALTSATSDLNQSASATLKSIGDSLRIALAKELQAHVSQLPRAKGWKHAARLNEELEPLVRNAQKVIGWSDGNSDGLVRINVVGQNVEISNTTPLPLEKSNLIPPPDLPDPKP